LKIVHYEEVEERVESEGDEVRMRWLALEEEGAKNCVMRYVRVGKNTEFHSHPWEHHVFVTKGRGAVKKENGEEVEIFPGTFIFIPKNEKHQFLNRGEDFLEFICVIPSKEFRK